ncbi:MAG: hypothetical protein M0021_05925 [Clostridia bacterium]|nr:hypothetical protein [Clostridia bacterium]
MGWLPGGHMTELPATNHDTGPVAEDTVTTGNAGLEFVRSRDRGDDLPGSVVSARRVTTPPGVDPRHARNESRPVVM